MENGFLQPWTVFFVNPGRWFGYVVVVFSRPGSASPRRARLFFLSVELLTMLQAVGPSLERQIKVPIFLSMFLRRREIRSFPQTFTLLLQPPPNKYICIKMYLSCSQINNNYYIEIL